MRVWFPAGLMLILVVTAGCTAIPADKGALVEFGAEAADVERGRAYTAVDRMATLHAQRAHLIERRDALLEDARSYRQKAYDALRDPGYAASERRPFAQQYLWLAERSERESQRYDELQRVYNERISLLDSRRQARLREAGRYDGMKVPSK